MKLEQFRELIANSVQSVEEAENFVKQLALTDWTSMEIPRSCCPLCRSMVRSRDILQDASLPGGVNTGCSTCLQAQRAIFRCICDGCGMRYRYPPVRASHIPLCARCYQRSYDARVRVNQARSRAVAAGLPATVTIGQWLRTLDHFGWRCAYCQAEAVEGYMGIDHYLPLCLKGGSTPENCVPCCPDCSRKKGTKHPGAIESVFGRDALDAIEAYLATRREIL